MPNTGMQMQMHMQMYMQIQIKIKWRDLKRISPMITFIYTSNAFPALISRINEDGANIKIDSAFEAGCRTRFR